MLPPFRRYWVAKEWRNVWGLHRDSDMCASCPHFFTRKNKPFLVRPLSQKCGIVDIAANPASADHR